MNQPINHVHYVKCYMNGMIAGRTGVCVLSFRIHESIRRGKPLRIRTLTHTYSRYVILFGQNH